MRSCGSIVGARPCGTKPRAWGTRGGGGTVRRWLVGIDLVEPMNLDTSSYVMNRAVIYIYNIYYTSIWNNHSIATPGCLVVKQPTTHNRPTTARSLTKNHIPVGIASSNRSPGRPHLPLSPVQLSRSSPPSLTCVGVIALAKATYEPACRSGVREHEDRVAELPNAPWSSTSSPQYHSVHNTPTSLSLWSTTWSVTIGNKTNAKPPPLLAEARSSSWWKILLYCLWFLMSLYQKVRALWPFSALRPGSQPASPSRVPMLSLEWCQGNANTAIRDTILYCKKSSVRALKSRRCGSPRSWIKLFLAPTLIIYMCTVPICQND
jgi:hypothetical protein